MSDGINITNQPGGDSIRSQRDTMHLERTVTDMRVEIAAGLAGINARLDAQKNHEPRLRAVELALANQLTRADVAGMLKEAIEAARRPAWRDVGALIAAIATSTGLVLGIARASGLLG